MRQYKLPMQFDDGKTMYSAVLKMINQVSPVLSKMIHDTPSYNPFSIMLPDKVNVICPALESLFQTINMNEIRGISFADCLTGQIDSTLRISFENTWFRKSGISNPIPDPWLVIRNWKERWNSVSPSKINMEIPLPGSRNADLEVHSGSFVIRKHKIADFREMPAFTGYLEIQWRGKKDDLHILWALARFAEYAGTGAKTTMGAGVTRIDERRRKRDVSPSQHAPNIQN